MKANVILITEISITIFKINVELPLEIADNAVVFIIAF